MCLAFSERVSIFLSLLDCDKVLTEFEYVSVKIFSFLLYCHLLTSFYSFTDCNYRLKQSIAAIQYNQCLCCQFVYFHKMLT